MSYRYHPPGGKPIALGTDKLTALHKVIDILRAKADAVEPSETGHRPAR